MRFSYLLALLIAAAAVGWILTGDSWRNVVLAKQQPINDKAPSVAERITGGTADAKTRMTAVRVRTSSARVRKQAIVVRGKTAAYRQLLVKAGTSGRIVELKFQQGDMVKKGQIIARIELSDLKARLIEARAKVRQRKLEYAAAKKLGQKGYRAETQIAGVAAQLDGARAYVKQIQVAINKTVIRAPFDAVVNEKHAEIGDYLDAKGKIATLVDQDPFLAVAQVSEQEVSRLKVGRAGQAVLIDGSKVEGVIRFIATVAEPNTRTFRVELQTANPEGKLRDGLSAELRFPVASTQAHLISPALLSLNDKGDLGVRAIHGKNEVAFYPVKIMGAGAQGVWINGLPNKVQLITVGSEFVRHGDRVRIVATP